MNTQSSNKEGSKKQEMEAVSLLRPGPKTHKFTSAMFYWPTQIQREGSEAQPGPAAGRVGALRHSLGASQVSGLSPHCLL